MPKPRFSSSELRYLTELDGFDHVAIVAVSAEDPDVFYGVARFVRLTEDPETAEAAIVVADSLQGQGLGRELGRRLADEARERGVKRFTASLLSDNVAAHRLFAAISERLDTRREGALEELVAELVAA
jgi:RimJ/RimL family protein N-acetyltransferase